MKIKNDLLLVLRELSPILAGFKLALIVTGWFGLGSVAQWVITRWYPFTRWVWDQVTAYFEFPELPVVVKDSLTALVFFLPLGIGALLSRNNNMTAGSILRHRLLAAFFGVLFLGLICKDVFTSIAEAIANQPNSSDARIVATIEKISSYMDGVVGTGVALGHVDKWRSHSRIDVMSMNPRKLSAVLS